MVLLSKDFNEDEYFEIRSENDDSVFNEDVEEKNRKKEILEQIGQEVVILFIVEVGKWLQAKVKDIFENPSDRILIYSQVNFAINNPTKTNRKGLENLEKLVSYFVNANIEGIPSWKTSLVPIYGSTRFFLNMFEGNQLRSFKYKLTLIKAQRDYEEYKKLLESPNLKTEYFECSEKEVEDFKKMIAKGETEVAGFLSRNFYYPEFFQNRSNFKSKENFSSIIQNYLSKSQDRVSYELSTMNTKHFN